jgi:mannitol-1-phosphate 5-dehydrogenase
MRAVVIGPGLIGCGFVGQLLRSSEWEVCFVGRGPVVDLLRRHRRYVVRLVDGADADDIVVDGVTAIPFSDGRATADAIAGADLVATAVGPGNLAAIAPTIASGLSARQGPNNVIAFENLLGAGPHLRDQVALHLPGGFPLDDHGFSGAVVSRAVSQRRWPTGPGNPLLFVGDRPSAFWVDRPALREPIPGVSGLVLTDQYEAHVQRKLYTYSAGHAACAYLGFLKGYHYIHTAIRDPEIAAAVRAAMAEGQRGLAARHGAELAGGDGELDAILARFANAGLADPILRVGRDPRRKLAANDRLVGAARLAAACGPVPETLALAVAAALVFCDPGDRSCRALHRQVAETGVPGVLEAVCGLDSDEGLGRLVAEAFERLSAGWAEHNLLLSLERGLWAWASPAVAGLRGPNAVSRLPAPALAEVG